MPYLIFVFGFLVLNLNAEDLTPRCGTPPPTDNEVFMSNLEIEYWKSENPRTQDDEPVNILVAWHVIHASSGLGNIPDSQIEDAVAILNSQYNGLFNFYFTLDTINRVENDDWFVFEPDEQAGQDYEEQEMRSSTAIDPTHYYNVWSVLTEAENGWITLGWNYFPFNSGEGSYWQGTTINYTAILGGTLEHEAGHYFGLFHTFQGNCTGTNDQVSDTPAMHYDGVYSCDQNQDTCPDLEGNDPVTNIMNYSDCPYDFTLGQAERAYYITEVYHPGLLENQFYYPNLFLSSIMIDNDSDQDGTLNPGETAQLRLSVGNAWGTNADSLLLTLSTEDPRLTIIDSIVQFSDSLSPGEISFGPLADWFEVHAHNEVNLGTVNCNLNMKANISTLPYEINNDVEISINLNQYGFPIDGMVIKSSPIIVDLDQNMINDIFFGSDNGKFYGYMTGGIPQYGFPFDVGDNIRSSPAVRDVDLDGVNEIVFGSNNGNLYILDPFGNQELVYNQSGMIIGSPALVDLDQNGDFEIVFTTQEGNSGKVYAITEDGEDVSGFPVNLGEKMLAGAAAGDLEGDGSPDIVVCTWGDNIYAIENDGTIKPGFPVTSTNRFNAPATLVDIDQDGDLEIVAGNDSGLLHVLHHDGTEMASFDTGDDIRGGISVADINDDGSVELLFTGYDDILHVWNPIDGVELDGWPFDMGSNSLTEPLTADLDNDGDLEIIAAIKNGLVFIFHHDGTYYANSPISISGSIESSPAIGDLDGDGDYEIIFGTTMGLKVLDIKDDKGDRLSWNMHRGNLERTGSLGMTLVSIHDGELAIPKQFTVSPNYPNPFNPTTSIDIQIAQSSKLLVQVFDAKGRLVNTLINNTTDAGYYHVTWNGKDSKGYDMSTGVYFISVASGVDRNTQKIILLK